MIWLLVFNSVVLFILLLCVGCLIVRFVSFVYCCLLGWVCFLGLGFTCVFGSVDLIVTTWLVWF